MPPGELKEALVEALGDPARVTDGESERNLHAADLTFHAPVQPDLVVFPVSTAEVARVLATANERGVPVTAFGAGTSLEGHVIPVRGGISLDLTRMNRIIEISPTDLTAVVQAGVTRGALDRALVDHGLHFPVDPGADATLGGMAATNAAGTTTIRYGKMRAQVLALEAVLADGSVVRTGSRAAKTSAGYDLTGLLVGSEGTLAVITELTLRVHGIPEHAVAIRISFPSLEAACRTAAAAAAGGVGVSRLELMDPVSVRAVNAHEGTAYPEAPCLFVEASGTREAVDGDLALVVELAREEEAIEIAYEREAEERRRLWSARHATALALTAFWPGRRIRSTDVCVPVSELAAAVETARVAVDRLGLVGAILGHAGDGNFHVAVLLDPENPRELEAYEELSEAIVDDALRRGGTSTGEHGVGLGKIAALEREHGDLVPLFQGLKQLFDPNGILNPGKVLAS